MAAPHPHFAVTPLRVFALCALIAAGAWAAWRSPYAEHWRWRRAVEAEHERAEAVIRGIALPEGKGGEPAGGRIVVAIGDRLTVDETGWALAQDWTGQPLNYGPWVMDFALDDDPLGMRFEPLEEELRAIAKVWRLEDDERVVELHAGRDLPFGTVRKVLYTVWDAGWNTWFRVAESDGLTALRHAAPAPPEIDGEGSPWFYVHLRADGLFVERVQDPLSGFRGDRRGSGDAPGVNLPKIGDKQDFLALDERMARDQRSLPLGVDWMSGARAPTHDVKLPEVAGVPNLVALHESLAHARDWRPARTVAMLNIDDDVPYGQMIEAFQIARGHDYPIALFGGPPGQTIDTPAPSPLVLEPTEFEFGTFTGTPTILGNLPRADIEPVVKRNMNQIRYCYQRELVKSPALKGKITVKFVITQDGSVSSATTKSSTMKHAGVESCINARFLRFTFPAPKGGGSTIVSYPFNFSQ